MLDRLFMSKMSRAGKLYYFVGQLVFAGIIAAVLFGAMDMSFDEGRLPLVGGILGVVIAWGVICTMVWPRESSPVADD